MRAVGLWAARHLDRGISPNATHHGQAYRLGRADLPLPTGDSILAGCVGLVKDVPSSTDPPVTPTDDFVRCRQTCKGQATARPLMSTALARNPVGDPMDRITLAVLQTEDPSQGVGRRGEQAAQQCGSGGAWHR